MPIHKQIVEVHRAIYNNFAASKRSPYKKSSKIGAHQPTPSCHLSRATCYATKRSKYLHEFFLGISTSSMPIMDIFQVSSLSKGANAITRSQKAWQRGPIFERHTAHVSIIYSVRALRERWDCHFSIFRRWRVRLSGVVKTERLSMILFSCSS